MLLEVRVLHRFISWQLRVRFWIIPCFLLDDSENKKNQIFFFYSFSEDCTSPISHKREPNLFSLPEREKIPSEMTPLPVFHYLRVALQTPVRPGRLNHTFIKALPYKTMTKIKTKNKKKHPNLTYTYLIGQSLFLDIVDTSASPLGDFSHPKGTNPSLLTDDLFFSRKPSS